MDFSIINTVNKLLKKRGMKQEYIAFVEVGRGALSPSIKVYHVTLYKVVYGDVVSKFIVDKFTEGGVFKNEEQVKSVLEEKLTEYFLNNGI